MASPIDKHTILYGRLSQEDARLGESNSIQNQRLLLEKYAHDNGFENVNILQREVDTMQRRSDELSALFKRLYEDNVLGRITNEQFRRLSADYNAEQKTLEDAIPAKLERLEKLRASAANVDAFIEKAKRFKTIDELTPELLRLFIERIEIGERAKKYSHSAAQDIRIVYRDIGMLDSQIEEGEQPVHMVTLPPNIDELKKLLA